MNTPVRSVRSTIGIMLARLLATHPTALARCPGRSFTGGTQYWFPLVNLVWLIWLLSSLWLWRLDTRARLLTVASLAVFLVLYRRAWYGPRDRALWNALAIGGLGLTLLPANESAWTYAIYAGAILPFATSARLALRLQAALSAALVLDARFLAHLPWIETASAVVVCSAIFVMNLFSSQERRRQAELRLSQDEIRRLAATAERERIGRDLHDLLGHTLSLIALKSELARRLLEREPGRAGEEVAAIERIAREALAQVRSAVTGMRAAGLAAELASARLMFEAAGIEFRYELPPLALPPEIETAFALGLREAATNVERHAGARQVRFDLRAEAGGLALRLRDDGRGGIQRRGNGLNGMEERLRALGGTLTIHSPPRGGTELCLWLPLPRVRQAATARAA